MLELLRAWFPNVLSVSVTTGVVLAVLLLAALALAGRVKARWWCLGVGAAGPAAGGPPPALLPRGAGGSDPARAAGGGPAAAGGGPPCPAGVTGGGNP